MKYKENELYYYNGETYEPYILKCGYLMTLVYVYNNGKFFLLAGQ